MRFLIILFEETQVEETDGFVLPWWATVLQSSMSQMGPDMRNITSNRLCFSLGLHTSHAVRWWDPAFHIVETWLPWPHTPSHLYWETAQPRDYGTTTLITSPTNISASHGKMRRSSCRLRQLAYCWETHGEVSKDLQINLSIWSPTDIVSVLATMIPRV